MKVFIKSIFFLTLAGALCPSSFAGLYKYYPEGYRGLGRGFDPSQPFSSKQYCFEYDGVEKILNHNEQKEKDIPEEWSFESVAITSRKDFYSKLDLSVELEARAAFANAHANVAYFSEESFHSDTFTWAVIASVKYEGSRLKGTLRLKPEFRGLSRRPLLAICGSEIVTEVYPGAKMVALFTVKNVSESAKSVLKSAFESGVGIPGFSAELKVRYENLMATLAANSMVTVQIKGFGGGGLTSIGESQMDLLNPINNMDGLKKFMKDQLRAMTRSNSVAWRYVTTDISAHFPTTYFSMDPRVSIPKTLNQDLLQRLFHRYRQNESIIHRLDMIIGSPREFSLSADEDQAYRSALSEYEENNFILRNLLGRALNGEQVKVPAPGTPVKWPRKHVICLSMIKTIRDDDRYRGVNEDVLKLAYERRWVPRLSRPDEDNRIYIQHWEKCPELED